MAVALKLTILLVINCFCIFVLQ